MKGKTWVIVAVLVVFLVIGFFFFKSTQPAIVLPSEDLFNIGPWAVRNTVFTSWIVIILMVAFSYIATRNSALVPVRGLQNFIEAVVEWLYGVVGDVAGEENARRFFPLIATFFLYIVCSNWLSLVPVFNTIGIARPPDVAANATANATIYHTVLLGPVPVAFEPLNPQSVQVQQNGSGEVVRTDGQPLATDNHAQFAGTLIPFFRSVYSDANAPLAIAIVSFFAVEYWGFATLGVGTYLGKFFNFKAVLHGNPLGFIDIFVGFLELISEFVRVVSFTFRLVGNIFAGEVLLVFMTFIVPFIFPAVFYALELFTGFIQAAVFALLTLVFAVMAVQHHEEHEEGHREEQVELEPV